MNPEADIVEHFYGVYLLYCKNPKYLGRTYIGYTVNPTRRIKQHNKGKQAGGAWRTSKKGPWEMVMIIHGFPNDIAALRFEWAWQHPHSSRRLHHVAKKKSREKTFDFCLRVLSEMLLVGPWNRLPLTVRWLKDEFVREFPPNRCPPIHMPICFGAVVSKKIDTIQSSQKNPNTQISTSSNTFCQICFQVLENSKKPLQCLNILCKSVFHIICLSKCFLKASEYVPIEGQCPTCDKDFLWGDIIRKYNGCYNNLDVTINIGDGNNFYDSD